MSHARFHIGIDLGGTKIEGILMDDQFQELERLRRPTEAQRGYEVILDNIAAIVQTLVQQVQGAEYTLGMGIPGIEDPESGLVRNANTTVLIGKPLGRDLGALLNHSIQIENDANCFTLAECRSGATRNFPLVFGVIMGTGCGGGLCINGRVRRGKHGISGEWGHVSMDPDGVRCYSGINGCIESMISGSGVAASFERTYHHPKAMAEIVSGWREADPQCSAHMQQFFADFGRAMGGLINVLDPDAIVIGGGLSNIPELYSLGIQAIGPWLFHD
ncbi:MAG: ROK family protein, partial [Leptospiraceae bacterium]|nr:ROK family protein [Leptospiraceae bacterium]